MAEAQDDSTVARAKQVLAEGGLAPEQAETIEQLVADIAAALEDAHSIDSERTAAIASWKEQMRAASEKAAGANERLQAILPPSPGTPQGVGA